MRSDFKFSALENIPKEFSLLKDPPQKLFFTGNLDWLKAKKKIAIVGTRRPSPYAKNLTFSLASKIAKNQGVIVSGGALGIDIIAQSAALPSTIMLSPASLDIIYPSSNADTIAAIAKDGLILSEYEKNYIPQNFSFIQRNRLVVALSDMVVIPQADLKSGSLQSAKIALRYNKPIFVFPHRLGESEGTNRLLQDNLAQAIYDMDLFVEKIFGKQTDDNDEFLKFCAKMPSFEEAYLTYGEKVLEYELAGKIVRENGFLKVL